LAVRALAFGAERVIGQQGDKAWGRGGKEEEKRGKKRIERKKIGFTASSRIAIPQATLDPYFFCFSLPAHAGLPETANRGKKKEKEREEEGEKEVARWAGYWILGITFSIRCYNSVVLYRIELRLGNQEPERQQLGYLGGKKKKGKKKKKRGKRNGGKTNLRERVAGDDSYSLYAISGSIIHTADPKAPSRKIEQGEKGKEKEWKGRRKRGGKEGRGSALNSNWYILLSSLSVARSRCLPIRDGRIVGAYSEGEEKKKKGEKEKKKKGRGKGGEILSLENRDSP